MDTFSKERERVQWCQKRRIDLGLPQNPPDWKPARISWSPSLLLLRTTVPTHNRIGERPDDPSSSNWLWHLWGERGPQAPPPPLPLLLPPPPPTPPRHSATMHPKGSLDPKQQARSKPYTGGGGTTPPYLSLYYTVVRAHARLTCLSRQLFLG